MRKSPLTRRQPLARTPFRRKPAKQRAGADARAEWSKQFDRCFCCCRREPLDTHEIAPRSRTEDCFELCNLLALCRGCHDVLQGSNAGLQAAFKFLEDRETFDLAALNRLRQRADGALTRSEVMLWVYVIQAIRGR